MQVREKTHRIDVTIDGEGSEQIAEILRAALPDAVVTGNEEDTVPWRGSDLETEIRAERTPGLVLRAYQEQAGMSVTDLATAVGTSYPNICAMEGDRRVIGLRMARKLAKVLGTDCQRFMGD